MTNDEIKQAYEKEGGPTRNRRGSDDNGMPDRDMLKIALTIAAAVIVLATIVFQTGV